MIVNADIKMEAAVHRTLQYFALFRYPLLASELRQYCSAACSEEDIQLYLDEQEILGNVFCFNGYYSLLPEVEPLLSRRIQGNAKAAKDLRKAKWVGRF